jgi:cytochrome b subunit of formate dehydrogenase
MSALDLFNEILKLFTNAKSETLFIIACAVVVIMLISGIVIVSKSPSPGETDAQINSRKKRGNTLIVISVIMIL